MVTQQIAIDELFQPTQKKDDNDPGCAELLLFFGRHPYTRFSRLAIVNALNAWKTDGEKAIKRLEEKGLLKSYTINGVSFYSLTVGITPDSPMAEKPFIL